MKNINEIADFLKLDVPAPVEEKDTFLSIAGFPHYENVISNIYAYYLDQEKEHGFKDMFLQALLSLLQKKKYGTEELLKEKLGEWSKWSVSTEARTQKGRIDIYLVEESEEEPKCILVENKIYHHANHNPFTDYWEHAKTTQKVGVILSLFSESHKHDGFINILHEELINEIKSLQGKYLEEALDKHILFLKDFFINIQQLYTTSKAMKEILDFYQNHSVKIEEVYELKDRARKYFFDEVVKLARAVEKPIRFPNSSVGRSVLVSEDPNIHVVFYFGVNKEHAEYAYRITFEKHEPGEDLINAFKKEDTLYLKLGKHGISPENGSMVNKMFVIAEKYYKFENLEDGLLSTLRSIYKAEWEPYIEEVRDFVKLYD